MLALQTACLHPTTNKPYVKAIIGGKDNSSEGRQVCRIFFFLFVTPLILTRTLLFPFPFPFLSFPFTPFGSMGGVPIFFFRLRDLCLSVLWWD